jgi:amino acid transporter
MNIPAFIITALVTALVFIGIKESKRSANIMVMVKIVILLVVIGVGTFYIKLKNWHPFMPNGFTGVLKGVSAVFYAYIGFDAISTTAEECKNPQRDLPRGMIYSLLICTVIYVVTTLVITGMVNYTEFKNISDPLAYVFNSLNMKGLGFIISISAVIAATSVILVFQLGQPRIWMSMSRDGLLPPAFSRIHPRFKTPAFATIVAGLLVGIPSLFLDSVIVTDLTSIGTLFAFALVCGGILVLPPHAGEKLRYKVPYINGAYYLPVLLALFLVGFHERLFMAVTHIGNEGYEEYLFILFVIVALITTIYTIMKRHSLIPLLGMLCCMYLMVEIPAKSWMVFLIWMGTGLVIYLSYGFRHSKASTAGIKV